MVSQWKLINENYKNMDGYKRVAWPPVSEERIIREFTPQPQTQPQAPQGQQHQQQQQPNYNQAPPQQHQQQHHQHHQQQPPSAVAQPQHLKRA